MALEDWIPPSPYGILSRNGYAFLSDLDDGGYAAVIGAMEGFQSEFLALTRPLWQPDFPISGDALSHYSRQWEYPYAWANLTGAHGRVLDAGSGFTFFPFLLAAAGFDVDCCDGDDSLGLAVRFSQAGALTGCRPRFTDCSLTAMSYPEGAFDAVVCISVLEHAGPQRTAILENLAYVLKPGGRLVVTFDLDLRRDEDLVLEDVSVLLAGLRRNFELAFPLDLRRPRHLLTSDSFLAAEPWRLPPPWRPASPTGGGRPTRASEDPFRSIAVLGVTAHKHGAL
jgi:SAM-dependent methyltransferase